MVAIGLGLAKRIHWEFDHKRIKPLLVQNSKVREDMYLVTEAPTSHTVRIKKIRLDGIDVMNPDVDFEFWDWQKLEDSKCSLAIFLLS